MSEPGTLLLHDNSASGGSSLLFRRPHRVLTTCNASEAPGLLAEAEAALARGQHIAGFLSYELGLLFEERLAGLLPSRSSFPLLWLGIYDAPDVLTRAEAWSWIGGKCGPERPVIADLAIGVSREEYGTAFRQVMRFIHAGDVYQVNLTMPAGFRLQGDAMALYRDLCLRQEVAHGAWLDTGEHRVLSLSPELFVANTGGRLVTRPMKGTIARGRDDESDAEKVQQLRADEKSRAENLMIVDLLRNDLGRVAKLGSVEVDALFAVETYASLHQMTSTVSAQLESSNGIREILAALFPCGSVTGAPKIRAMQIIHDVEAGPRGLYTGSIGHIAAGGDFRFNVAIRTAVIDVDGNGRIGVGGGVVADSEEQAEYEEALLKLRFLQGVHEPFGLIETFAYDGTSLVLEERHLSRMCASAADLGLPCDRQGAEAALFGALAGRSEPARVRLLLREDGGFDVAVTDLKPMTELSFTIAPLPVHSTDPLLRHKTTRRAVYDVPRADAACRLGVDEVVFLNERGELTEGSFTNLFVQKDGRLLTPPVTSGLLPGTLRAELLDTGRAHEAVLNLAALEDADAVFFGNSVRGLLPARWVRMA
jgi:para-aminobenzoate synthetase/4-amino-4-deoxychorismate lyase